MMGRQAPGGFPRRKLKARGDDLLFKAITEVIPTSKSVMDLGCGVGRYVRELRELGYTADGVDGGEGVKDASKGIVKWADLTADCQHLFGVADWGLFIEVGEHVPEKLEGVLIDNISQIPTEGLIVSWGSVGQRGYGHINCRCPEYIASEFARRGWFVNHESTRGMRSVTGKSYKRRVMVLER